MSDDLKARIADYLSLDRIRVINRNACHLLDDCLKRIEELEQDRELILSSAIGKQNAADAGISRLKDQTKMETKGK